MKKIVLNILFCLLFFSSNAQEKIEQITIDNTKIEQKKFDEDAIKNYKKSDEFNYNVAKKEPNFLEKIWNWLGRNAKRVLRWMFNDIGPSVGVIKTILQVIPYVILGLALYFMIKFFLRVNTSSKTLNDQKINSVFPSEEEELIKNQDLEKLIEQAIENSNYREAIRFYYLFILKKLTENELIIWQQDKTNEEYVAEINKESIQQDFKNTTRLYDFVWYGNFEINKTDFLKAKSLFESLTNKIIG